MKRRSFSYSFIFALLLFFASSLILFPKEAAQSVREALLTCGKSVIPSLFPFLTVSKLLINLRFTDIFERVLNKFMRPVFSVGGSLSSALALGFIGGYPIGALTCVNLYTEKLCTEEETERTLAFCNNCGPAFIIGAVGSGFFSSSTIGIALLLIHIVAALSVGIILRIVSPIRRSDITFKHESKKHIMSFPDAFTDAVSSSLKSILNICTYIILFSAFLCAMQVMHILPLLSAFFARIFKFDISLVTSLLSGFFEMTVGIYSIDKALDFNTAFIATAFLLGWGGLSVHCQTLSALSSTALSLKPYFIGKLLHGILSALYSYIVLYIFKINVIPTFSPMTAHGIQSSFSGMSILICAIIFIFYKKGWKKTE